MNNGISPEMTVIVLTPDRYDTVRKTIRHLRAQRLKNCLEIVLVAPAVAELGLDKFEMQEFLQYRVVEIGTMRSTAKARAIGVQHSSAPIVAFVEDHAYPAPGWAEAIINAHKHGWAAVGPVIANANPYGLISWANLLIEYSDWLEPAAAGIADHLPGHNGSYKRDLLLNYGDRLEAMLSAESVLQWDLRARGHLLYLEPRARTFHQNFSAAFSSIPLRFYSGRLFAASRARDWPLWKRCFYLGGAPLIPVVRLLRILRKVGRPGRPRHLIPSVLPALVVGLLVDGAGELIGYAFGPGNSMARLSDMEFHRNRHLGKMEKKTTANLTHSFDPRYN